MKLITFVYNDCIKIGSLKYDKVIDLKEARTLHLLSKGFSVEESLERAYHEIPDSMINFIEGGENQLRIAKESEDFIQKNDRYGKAIYLLRDIKLMPPIPNPPMILNMGNAYRNLEIKGFGWKPITSIIGPDESIIIPKEMENSFGPVYEPELGIIIGKKGRRIPNDESAYDYVYGYTIYNDITDYGAQMKGGTIASVRKLYDTFCPIGPCVTTKDEVGDPYNIRTRVWINNLLACDRNTKRMKRKIPEFVSVPSQTLTLLPGTIISTGGISSGRIKPGEFLEIEMTKLGKIRNPVILEK